MVFFFDEWVTGQVKNNDKKNSTNKVKILPVVTKIVTIVL